jgi:hypothetical protein
MLASEVTSSSSQAVEDPRAFISGALKDQIRGLDSALYIFQVATDFRMGARFIIASLGMPCHPAEHDRHTFIISGLEHILRGEASKELLLDPCG